MLYAMAAWSVAKLNCALPTSSVTHNGTCHSYCGRKITLGVSEFWLPLHTIVHLFTTHFPTIKICLLIYFVGLPFSRGYNWVHFEPTAGTIQKITQTLYSLIFTGTVLFIDNFRGCFD